MAVYMYMHEESSDVRARPGHVRFQRAAEGGSAGGDFYRSCICIYINNRTGAPIDMIYVSTWNGLMNYIRPRLMI
jgi:hypothetical protein